MRLCAWPLGTELYVGAHGWWRLCSYVVTIRPRGLPWSPCPIPWPLLRPTFLQVDRHLPTMTVEETRKFACDSMAGGTHLSDFGGDLNDEQKELVAWMDAKYFKVMPAQH